MDPFALHRRPLERWAAQVPPLSWLKARFDRHQVQIWELRTQVRVLAAEVRAARFQAELQEILSLLKPMKAVGVDKVRLGTKLDGAYVMLDDFASVRTAYSLGVGDNVDWDVDIARRGIKVHQFDNRVRKSPVQNEAFTFRRQTIESVADLSMSDEKRQLLKIDIEEYEWEFFDRASVEELSRFSQIAGEFHNFDFYYMPEWRRRTLRVLKKLNQTHQLIHVHGNNYAPAFWTGTMEMPINLELTYALRSEYTFADTAESFPGPLDCPNDPKKEEYVLNQLLG